MIDYKGNTVVVTAVTGSYDQPKPHAGRLDGVDYIAYSDGTFEQPGWQNVLLENPLGLNARMLAKGPKTNPHLYKELRDYKYMVWIDGSMIILQPTFVTDLLSHLRNGFVVSPHYDQRYCGYGEGELSMQLPKYPAEVIRQQMNYYEAEGFPRQYGLYAMGISARDMTNPRVAEVGALWYQQNLTWSFQDQVSFPYVLWRLNYQPDPLPMRFWDYYWVNISNHISEDY